MTRRKPRPNLPPVLIGGEYGNMDDFMCNTIRKGRVALPQKCKGDDYPYDVVPLGDAVDESKRLGLFNLFRIYANPTAEKIQECEPGKYALMVDTFRIVWDIRRPEHEGKYGGVAEFMEPYFRPILDAARRHGDRVWICPSGERDSVCAWPEQFFRNKKEAYRWWKKYFFGSGKSGQSGASPVGVAATRDWLAQRGFDNLALHSAMLFSLHYYYEWGFRFVWLERGCELSNQQVALAFLRGAARPHGGLWGLDYSTWSPPQLQLTWYDTQGRRRGGASESLMLRTWMAAYLSGADFVFEEGSDTTHWVRDGKTPPQLSLAGEYARRFADFALRRHPERGTPCVPVAVMLDYYHGYGGLTGLFGKQAAIWGNRVPRTAEDDHITKVFEMFFPDHTLAWTQCYKGRNAAAPWESAQEYFELLKSGHDMRPYEKGHLVASPYGDSVDVVLNNASRRTFGRYGIVILAGRQEFGRGGLERLAAYVERGGTLVAALSQLPKEFLSRAGVKVETPRWRWEYDSATCVEDGKRFSNHPYGYATAEVAAANARTLAVNSKGAPLAWEVPMGRGRVVLSAVPHTTENVTPTLLPVLQHVIGKYVTAAIPASADPARLEIIVNSGERSVIVGAINNEAAEWQGRIAVRALPSGARVRGARDIWNDAPAQWMATAEGCAIEDRIAPFEIKVYRVDLEG